MPNKSMPRGLVSIEIEASCESVFNLIHDYDKRLNWDSMLSKASILGDAEVVSKGVRTLCVGQWRIGWIAIETEYINFERGRVAAVKLTNHPLFFRSFAATIRHKTISDKRSQVTYIYAFKAKPSFLAFAIEPIMNTVMLREVRGRLAALRAYLENPMR